MNMINKTEVHFGEWIDSGFRLYKENIIILIFSMLIVFVLSTVTLGILAGPMIAGFISLVLKLKDNKINSAQNINVKIDEIFTGFNVFIPALIFVIFWSAINLLASFLLSFIPCIGAILALFITYAIWTFLLFGLFLIIDKKMDFWTASKESYYIVKTNFWSFLALNIIASIIGAIGGLFCLIGLTITMPIYYCIIAAAYRDIFK